MLTQVNAPEMAFGVPFLIYAVLSLTRSQVGRRKTSTVDSVFKFSFQNQASSLGSLFGNSILKGFVFSFFFFLINSKVASDHKNKIKFNM